MEGLKINKEQQVVYTNNEDAYVISSRDWKRIKKYINKLTNPSSVWSNVTWGSLGIGVSCVVSWLANREKIIFLVFGAIGICAAACSYFASKSEAKHRQGSVDNLIEIVTEIEEVLVPHKEDDQ